MGIFQIFFIRREIKKGLNDPSGFVIDQLLDFVKGYLILGGAVGILILVPLCILGYFGWLGGPYGVAKFFFWFFLIIFGISETIITFIYLKVRKILKRQIDRTIITAKAKILDK